MINNIFQTKKDNNVWFIMSKRPSSNIQGKSILSRQSASNSNDIVKMCDDNKSLSNINPGKPFWSTFDEISKKDTTPSVFKVHPCLRNNSFANDLLENKDSFFRTVTNIDDVDIPQDNYVNMPLKNNNQSSNVNIPDKKSQHTLQ